MPEFAHVELGSGNRDTLRLADYAACARQARQDQYTFAPPSRDIISSSVVHFNSAVYKR